MIYLVILLYIHTYFNIRIYF